MVRFDTYNASAHFVRQLEASGVASVVHDGGDNLLVELAGGELISIYLIETRIPAYELRLTLSDNDTEGVYSLFILWSDMFLHSEGYAFQPEDWLLALVHLYGGKVYAFDVYGKDIRIFPAYFERVSGQEYHIRYGKDINVTHLGCGVAQVSHADIRGAWKIADFAHEPAARRADQQQKRSHTAPAAPRPLRTAWEVLGLSPVRDPELVKQAYRRLARRYHPDLNQSTEATLQMQRLNAAYDAIMRELASLPPAQPPA